MEAAAENNKEFIVLDRPNPIGGLKIEGNVVEDGYISFVSQFKIPYLYGLTCERRVEVIKTKKVSNNFNILLLYVIFSVCFKYPVNRNGFILFFGEYPLLSCHSWDLS